MKWKRKNQTDRLYKGKEQVVVRKIDEGWSVLHRNGLGHWNNIAVRATREEAMVRGVEVFR